MPIKPMRPCNQQGCPNLTDQRYCDRHAKEKQKQQDERRGSAAARGYDRTWQRIRKSVLINEPLCRRCIALGRVVIADVVHHINGNQYDNRRANLESLCKQHHDEHTAREQGFNRKG